MVTAVTIHDLQDAQNPAVVRALKIGCGLCFVKAGTVCDTPTGVVHFVRATAHYPEAKGEK